MLLNRELIKEIYGIHGRPEYKGHINYVGIK